MGRKEGERKEGRGRMVGREENESGEGEGGRKGEERSVRRRDRRMGGRGVGMGGERCRL